MKIIIAGTRDFSDLDFFLECVLETKFDISEIVSGGALGADRLGENFAKSVDIPLKVFSADWKKYGKAAGPLRNKQMAHYADGLIAFWNGRSLGTGNMISTIKKMGKPLEVWEY